MLEQLIELDRVLFHLVNVAWGHPFLDALLPWLRDKYLWTPLYIFIVAFMLVNYGVKGWLPLVYLGITIILCDQISSSYVKPFFERLRPCNEPFFRDQINLLVNCGKGYSFTSSHATNHFGVAMFLGVFFLQKTKWVLVAGILWAFAVSYSQVYVGVHYPLDIVGGAMLGGCIGFLLGSYGRRNFF